MAVAGGGGEAVAVAVAVVVEILFAVIRAGVGISCCICRSSIGCNNSSNIGAQALELLFQSGMLHDSAFPRTR